MRTWIIASAALAFCLVGAPESKALVFGDDARLELQDFAKARHLDPKRMQALHAASGLIQCGAARGAGQLTGANNVVTTAAHVFYDRAGRLRADSAHCLFSVEVGGVTLVAAIDLASIIAGSPNPYALPAVHDWAVARLMRPILGAKPYAFGGLIAPEQKIEFVARGHQDWGGGRKMSIQDCQIRQALDAGAEGTRELAFDCDAGVGASGGAILNAAGNEMLGIFVGFRSVSPDQPLAFSPQRYNFAVTLEGAFRRAVETAAGRAKAADGE